VFQHAVRYRIFVDGSGGPEISGTGGTLGAIYGAGAGAMFTTSVFKLSTGCQIWLVAEREGHCHSGFPHIISPGSPEAMSPPKLGGNGPCQLCVQCSSSRLLQKRTHDGANYYVKIIFVAIAIRRRHAKKFIRSIYYLLNWILISKYLLKNNILDQRFSNCVTMSTSSGSIGAIWTILLIWGGG